MGEEIWCDDTKFTSLRYVTKDNNYDHINCSGVSLSSGEIVLDQLHRNECMLQFSDSLRIVIFDQKFRRFIIQTLYSGYKIIYIFRLLDILTVDTPAGEISKNFRPRMKL